MFRHNYAILAPPPQPLDPAEGGSDLCTFVSTATSHVIHALQKPCKSRPTKRKVNLRRFLQNQICRLAEAGTSNRRSLGDDVLHICRSFSDIEAATQSLASSILSQEALALPKEKAPLKPPSSHPAQTPPGSFSGIAEAFAAPDPSPGWSLSLESLTSEPGQFFEPIAKENLLDLDAGGSNLLGYDPYPESQSCVLSTVCGKLLEPPSPPVHSAVPPLCCHSKGNVSFCL